MSLETKVGGRFVLMKKLGQGSFGDIYLGRDSDKTPVAMKLEATRARHLQLAHEYRVLTSLNAGLGIPSIRWFGKEGDYRVLIMDLLGSDLEDLRLKCASRRFSLKTVLMLADQLISRIEFIHSKHYLHRDVKPENFLMGINTNDHLVYAIDFGLAKSYRDPRTLRHATYREDCCLEGTARYASVNTHLGFEQSRRDDLESLGYMLIYLLRGSLPWQGLAGKTKGEKYAAISAKKMETSIDDLTMGLPPEFATYLTYCVNLTFTAEPNYLMLRRLFREVMTREGFEFDYMYDWTKQKRAPQPAPPHIPPLPEVSLPPTSLAPPPPPVSSASSSSLATMVSEERGSVKSVNFHADEQPGSESQILPSRDSQSAAPRDSQILVPRESLSAAPSDSQILVPRDSQTATLKESRIPAPRDSQTMKRDSQTILIDSNNNVRVESQHHLAPDNGEENYDQNSESKLVNETKELRLEDTVEYAVSDMGDQSNSEQRDGQQSEYVTRACSEASSQQASLSQPPYNPDEVSISPLAQTEFATTIPSPISRRNSENVSLPTLYEQQHQQHQQQHVIQVTEPDHQITQIEPLSSFQAPPPPPPSSNRNSVSGVLRAQHKVTPLPRVSPRYSAHSATSKTLAVFGGKHTSLPGSITHTQNSTSVTTASTPTAAASSASTPVGPGNVTTASTRSPGRLPALPPPSRRISTGDKPWHQPRSPGRKDSRRGVASPSPKA